MSGGRVTPASEVLSGRLREINAQLERINHTLRFMNASLAAADKHLVACNTELSELGEAADRAEARIKAAFASAGV